MDNFHDLFFDENIRNTQNTREDVSAIPAPPQGFDQLSLTQAFRDEALSERETLPRGNPVFASQTASTQSNARRIPRFTTPSQRKTAVGIVQPTNAHRPPSVASAPKHFQPLRQRTPPAESPQCLDIARKTPGETRSGILRLRPVSELPETYQEIFHFPYFNAVQSQALDDVLYSDRPVVVCAPTGSGKTVLFELAIIRLLISQTGNITSSYKMVYMAPIKALCTERYTDWTNKFTPLGLKCMELTGDSEVDDYFELQDVNIILTTPEKWDSLTRRWRDNHSFVHMVCLYMIDEVHMLNDKTRGATMEAVVSRMKTVNAQFKTTNRTEQNKARNQIRFIAVSATIPNAEDVGAWLSTDEVGSACHKLDESHRPVRLRKVVLGFPWSDNQSEFRFDLSLNYKLAGIIETYSEHKPSLVFCATRKGTQQAAATLVKDARFAMGAHQKATLMQVANHLREAKLRELVVHGVAYHHAGLDVEDRRAIEGLFTAGELPVLISTSTLSMGVNLPAHLVVIKSTQYYVMGSYQEYSETSILQMIGRAGRPQFDTSATAVIMTRSKTKVRYEGLMNGTQLIESSLHKNLVEHLNAEVVLATINDVSVALDWLKSTFLYIRVMKNPKNYDLSPGMSVSQIDEKLQELCLRNLNALAEVNLIQMEEDAFGLKPTDSGRVMARYCIAFETMKKLQALDGDEEISDMVTILCGSEEFKDIQLRNNEKKTLNTLNKDKNRATIRFPMEGKIKTNGMKVNCLIQAALGCLSVQDFGLSSDTNKILRSATRISKCLVEICWHKTQFKGLYHAIQLAKCFKSRLWENSKYIARQLPGIGDKLATMLVNSGITTFQKLEETNPREIELIVNRHPPFGNQVRDVVTHLPKYEVLIDQIATYNEHSAEITISISMVNASQLAVQSTAGPHHTCILLIGDSENSIVFKSRVSDGILIRGGNWSKRIEIKRAPRSDELNVHFISQDYAGLDVNSTYTPFYTGLARITNNPTHQNTRTNVDHRKEVPGPKVAPVLEAGRRACGHLCADKSMCAHECCKTGVLVRNKSTALQSYRQELKKRNTLMAKETPIAKHFKPDFSQFQAPSRQSMPWHNLPESHTQDIGDIYEVDRQRAYDPQPLRTNDNDWDDIELHRQRAKFTASWEPDVAYQPDQHHISLQDDYNTFESLGKSHILRYQYEIEDFQDTNDANDEDTLPDLVPPCIADLPGRRNPTGMREMPVIRDLSGMRGPQGIRDQPVMRNPSGMRGSEGIRDQPVMRNPPGMRGSEGIRDQPVMRDPPGMRGPEGIRDQPVMRNPPGMRGSEGIRDQPVMRDPPGMRGPEGIRDQPVMRNPPGMRGSEGIRDQPVMRDPPGMRGPEGIRDHLLVMRNPPVMRDPPGMTGPQGIRDQPVMRDPPVMRDLLVMRNPPGIRGPPVMTGPQGIRDQPVIRDPPGMKGPLDIKGPPDIQTSNSGPTALEEPNESFSASFNLVGDWEDDDFKTLSHPAPVHKPKEIKAPTSRVENCVGFSNSWNPCFTKTPYPTIKDVPKSSSDGKGTQNRFFDDIFAGIL